ncbi:MAG: oligopeptide transporter, OPT family [Calditrichae bacterium]|nr:oligopeptide transporter, OPT family [Calditrichia bacterium]NIV71919.1 oligopeptide transporter, OPT family [Calditrichia bacterium]
MAEFKPYVPADTTLKDFSVRALIMGALFGIVFGGANAYLGLRVGLTISTAIPLAVISVALFKSMEGIWGKASILEANIAQTTGSASSSLASGIIFTIPALFMWNLAPALAQITLLGMLGGILGIVFMIPLRRFLIVKEHYNLPYPEGTAAAQVLIAADTGGTKAKFVFQGLGLGFVYKAILSLAKFWPSQVSLTIPGLKKGVLGLEAAPALLGVGYILGFRIAAIMVAGGLLSWLGIIPAIAHFGEFVTVPLFPESNKLISDMTAHEIWDRYVRYIGAGAVATGGIISMVKALPTMIDSLKVGIRELTPKAMTELASRIRTDRDLSFKIVVGVVALFLVISISTPYVVGVDQLFITRLVGSIAIAIFAFIFVTVSSRIVGLVGVTSNPTSGMTIVTLLGTSLVFFTLGWTDDLSKAAVLTIGTVVAVAASIAGDISQDLKAGYLLGATPRRQQGSELFGAITSAFFIALAVMTLVAAYGVPSNEIPAPQATLMKTVIDGVLQANLPWSLVLIGASFAIVAELLSVPSLPFAVGIYLPLSTMTPIFVGGVIRRIVQNRTKPSEEEDVAEQKTDTGVLLGSGLIAGEGIMGVAIAALAVFTSTTPKGVPFALHGIPGEVVSFAVFLALGYYIFRSATRKRFIE